MAQSLADISVDQLSPIDLNDPQWRKKYAAISIRPRGPASPVADTAASLALPQVDVHPALPRPSLDEQAPGLPPGTSYADYAAALRQNEKNIREPEPVVTQSGKALPANMPTAPAVSPVVAETLAKLVAPGAVPAAATSKPELPAAIATMPPERPMLERLVEQLPTPTTRAEIDTRRLLGTAAGYIPIVGDAGTMADQLASGDPWGAGLTGAMAVMGGAPGKAGKAVGAGVKAVTQIEKAAAKGAAKTAAKLGDVAAETLPGIGHNMPPPEMRITPQDVATAPSAAQLPQPTWAQGLPRPKPAAKSTALQSLRGLPVDQAIDIARNQPHLIKSGEKGEGLYVGGPREIQSKAALNKLRENFDAYVAADPRGADWYDRYRRGMTEVTGGDPLQNKWMSAQEGQWSAGVDPGSELHFTLKENNSALAGMPVKAGRPAPHEAHLRAIAAQDPGEYLVGEKTGEYASKISPDQPLPPGATGVNDFRHARNFKYTDAAGSQQRDRLTDAAHRFLDHETALAVDRANQSALGGRTDWTGEKLQAAPWVRQKALDFMERNPALTYDEAFARANRTIADFFDKHTYFATHEAQPGYDVVGHMPQAGAATPAQRQAFFDDPRSTWATAPGNRDAIYAGLGIEGTGNTMRVRPTQPMQGMYRRPDGTLETNPGAVARPLGTFDTGKVSKGEPFKQATKHDQAILNAGETLRAIMDAQNAGSWHKLWFGGPANQSNTLFYPRAGKSPLQDLFDIEKAGAPHGLPDVADTGQGITSTRFYPPPEGGKGFERALRKGEFEFGQSGPEPRRARMDSNLLDIVNEWKQGLGSRAASQKLLDAVSVTPELRAAFNNNPHLAEIATSRLERDKDWAGVFGAPREDIQNFRAIVGTGKGWVDRLDAAIKSKAILPVTAAAIFAAAAASQQEGAPRAGS